MTDIAKLKKAELIDYIQEIEENKYLQMKLATGMPYDTEEEWIEYVKRLQDLNAERLNDCEKLIELVKNGDKQLQDFINNSVK
tara:strand:- start:2345 stop:2593 length:249 start_codon:yes stop_codon:yes gene_type:complete